MYSGPSRAFWELLQNADDCSYGSAPALKVAHAAEYLWLEYNEVPDPTAGSDGGWVED